MATLRRAKRRMARGRSGRSHPFVHRRRHGHRAAFGRARGGHVSCRTRVPPNTKAVACSVESPDVAGHDAVAGDGQRRWPATCSIGPCYRPAGHFLDRNFDTDSVQCLCGRMFPLADSRPEEGMPSYFASAEFTYTLPKVASIYTHADSAVQFAGKVFTVRTL